MANLLRETWAMEPIALERFISTLQAADWSAAMQLQVDLPIDGEEDPGYDIQDGMAVVQVSGVLMKSVPALFRAFGMNASGYQQIGAAISHADANPAVDRIMLMVDSPGGSVAGVQRLGDLIHGLKKPSQAHVMDLCASAAYWLAAQTDMITSTRSADIGSIGVYGVVYDSSKAYADAGIKVSVVASGKFKGAGVSGTEVTDEQLSEMRRGIEASADGFITDVARGRGADATHIRELADGRVWSAADALPRGLIDSITADPMKEYRMSKSVETLAALIEAHPAHAVMIAGLAKTDKTEEQILAAVVAKDQEAKAAKEAAELADLRAANVAKDEALALAKGEAEKSAKDAAEWKGKHDALAAHAAAPGAKISGDGKDPVTVRKIPLSKSAEISAADQKALMDGSAVYDETA